tara:strand:+ start:53133 stop:53243 length:111 start_codon:yes stop_codon:yes gene_type:complete
MKVLSVLRRRRFAYIFNPKVTQDGAAINEKMNTYAK